MRARNWLAATTVCSATLLLSTGTAGAATLRMEDGA